MMSFQCPDCKRVSHNPRDAEERYCGACNRFFGYPNIAFDSFEDEAEVWGEIYWLKVWWKRFKRKFKDEVTG